MNLKESIMFGSVRGRDRTRAGIRQRCWRSGSLRVELLESRVVPSGNSVSAGIAAPQVEPMAAIATAPFSPGQIRHAYGIDGISFGAAQGDGTGQTIAIVDAYHNPNVASDLESFDKAFGLPAPPSLRIINEHGGTNLPSGDVNWGVEIALDVQWAHAIAPGAKIVLVEASTASFKNLFTAAQTAATQPGVSVVSMSFGGGEWADEIAFDSTFTAPGVSYVAAAGDSGAPAQYPAASPNVLAVGGTSLTIDNHGNYVSEKAWSNAAGATGGGPSVYEAEPTWQKAVQSSGARGTPDVSFVGDLNTGVYLYDSYGLPGWLQAGGTSLGAPAWAGLLAIANQGRAINHLPTLGNAAQAVYTLPSSMFHDVTVGSNGYPAGPGYDFATGLGTPVANRVVPALAQVRASTPALPTPKPKSTSTTTPPSAAATLALASSVTTPVLVVQSVVVSLPSASTNSLGAIPSGVTVALTTPAPATTAPAAAGPTAILLAHSEPDGLRSSGGFGQDIPVERWQLDRSLSPMPGADGLPRSNAVPVPGVAAPAAPDRLERDSFFSQEDATDFSDSSGVAQDVASYAHTAHPTATAAAMALLGVYWRAHVRESESESRRQRRL
jgi:hypothetical protein